ncbi:MAG: efflux transporter periplasmic adaptor subunit [Rhodanobacter sp. 68-29]|uniref:efflux RND transporter periplasmic adaptor subunit n=1 Tax=Rhodanobacter sp. PCA2 TaxID=2006117 RepID=UPI00086E3576|nr:efflux RND transporter periplasmic adaptor subunit [Rhodanobacter sp. PCA2]MBA2080009.1 efflux transporter periplasmic adaptor subunit [Rhodanobacter sp. PCA2]MBN8923765.1 efflux RND transporter periplasmic adaptor subunit [Rhodanobacter sp.]ODU75636.1 MAG: efflux transporter periplasmic adaptor subunit [Rhodanobacter sp. SCN 69-32]OJY56923.1 MAG: efflux transporter periplasmic adaptor subunit [Rhodanobacter sp. 68-29]
MSRFWKIALVVVAVVVVAVVAVRLLHKPGGGGGKGTPQGPGGKDNPPVPVTVVPVAKQNVPVYLTALGTVQALNTIAVNPQVGGQLVSLAFTEGQQVKKGQVLAQIDPRTYQASYDQAVSKRNQDQSLLATARSNYERSKDPKYSQYVAKIDLITQHNTVAQYEAAVAADNAAISSAKTQLDYTQIRSPIDGLAGIRGVDPGNVVTTSSTIVTLTQLHPINVMFTLPEQSLDMVRKAQDGAPLQVTALDRVDAHPVATGGVLKVIDNQIDTSTGTFRLKSEFPNADNALWPGQFVNVRLQVRVDDGALVVPAQAVQRGPDGDYVYQVQGDNTVKMQPVVVAGEVGDSHVMIGSGLKAGEQVVTEGQFRLKPGSKVNPLKPGEVPPAPTAADLKKASEQGKGGGRRGR